MAIIDPTMTTEERESERDNQIRTALDSLWQDVGETGVPLTTDDVLDVLSTVIESLDEYFDNVAFNERDQVEAQ